MKKAIFFLAATAILFAACDYTSKKPSSVATDSLSTIVADSASADSILVDSSASN
jgi:hypothetical protein